MFCNVTVMGRVGHKPDRRENGDWGGVTSVRLAVTKLTRGEKVTTWVRVSAFGKLGEYLARTDKGLRVLVSGELYAREYTGKDGTPKQSVEVIAKQVQLVDWPEPDNSMSDRPDDDVPF